MEYSLNNVQLFFLNSFTLSFEHLHPPPPIYELSAASAYDVCRQLSQLQWDLLPQRAMCLEGITAQRTNIGEIEWKDSFNRIT